MATASTLKKDIAQMESALADASTPDSVKDAIRPGLAQAKSQLAALEASGGAAKAPRARTSKATKAAPAATKKAAPKKAAPKKEAKAEPAKKPRKRTTAKKATTKKGGLSDRAKKRIAAAKKRRKAQGLPSSMKDILKDAKRVAPYPGREKRDNRVDYARGSYPYLEQGGEMAKGGLFGGYKRPKSAMNRDRAYKSEEPWEKKYVRKTPPKNPRYKRYGEGGETHRNG